MEVPAEIINLEASSNLLRLISIFNITDTFEKITNLNFAKMYKSGFEVDKVTGGLTIKKTKVSTRIPIIFQSGSSQFKWTGFVNRSKEGDFSDLDFEVVMTLPIKEYLPAYAFLIGGPITAGIVYIAGKAFERRLDKLSSGKWRIWGDIDNTKTEFLGWFED